MKKIFIILLSCLMILSFDSLATSHIPDAKEGIPYQYTPPVGSVEELYKDIIATLLEPYISNDIKEYYGAPYNYDLFNMDFLKIDRPTYRAFDFIVQVEVKPFIGPHNTLGIDHITFRITPNRVRTIAFKHVKSFPILSTLKKSAIQ